MDCIVKGALPWFGAWADKGEAAKPLRDDPQNEIETCLRCSKEECNNCLEAFDRKYHGGRPKRMTTEELRLFLRIGDTKAACTFFGCDRTTIWRRLREEDGNTETNNEKEGNKT